MLFASANTERKTSLLQSYSGRMGSMVDRRLAQIALEAARREAVISAEQARAHNRAKSEFLANVSHELHTPLSNIIGFAEMMQREVMGQLPAVYRDYARNIHDSGRQLLAMVGDILDMSQIEAGNYPLKEEACDLSEIVQSVFRVLQGRAAQAGLYLQARIAPGTPRLFADARALKQILINLISNSIKFTSAGGRVFVLPETLADGALAIRVVDTGIGIKEADLARILEPFERGADAPGGGKPGAGLGLTLVAAYVRAHGGKLGIQSKSGAGTIVTVTFPASRARPAAPVLEAAAAPAANA
jgi:signal transduction histidine kinase